MISIFDAVTVKISCTKLIPFWVQRERNELKFRPIRNFNLPQTRFASICTWALSVAFAAATTATIERESALDTVKPRSLTGHLRIINCQNIPLIIAIDFRMEVFVLMIIMMPQVLRRVWDLDAEWSHRPPRRLDFKSCSLHHWRHTGTIRLIFVSSSSSSLALNVEYKFFLKE